MLMFLVILLVVLWLVGMVTTTRLVGWLHILLVVAVTLLTAAVVAVLPGRAAARLPAAAVLTQQ